MSLFQESIIRKHLGYLDQEVVEQAYLRFKEVYSANKITNINLLRKSSIKKDSSKIFSERSQLNQHHTNKENPIFALTKTHLHNADT
jgi:hypothetical protein